MKTCLKSVVLLLLIFSAFIVLTDISDVSASNNKVGVHIINDSEVEDAAELVNSNGGDWGYVTFVIREDQIDSSRYNLLFQKLEEYHLIPIVRMATTQTGKGWSVPDEASIKKWISFFESLDWPAENRYIIVGNEPNHAKEWGGNVSPQEYASYLRNVSISLKSVSDSYFILPAALDASAPNSNEHMDEELFIRWMMVYDRHIFSHIDGWNSHSYPNPAFSGSETDMGRGSIRTYEWELKLLKEYGVSKQLPVFITETGWVHDSNGRYPWLITDKEAGERMKYAFENVWKDDRIVAVTPFILSYNSEPFDTFSMQDPDGAFNMIFENIKVIAKVKGVQTDSSNTTHVALKRQVCMEGMKKAPMSHKSTLFAEDAMASVIW